MAGKQNDNELEKGLEDTFPASDPPAPASTPHKDEVVKKPTSPEGEDLAKSGTPGASVTSQGG